MLKITKKAYSTYKEWYSIEIDEDYRQSLTNDLNELIVNEDEKIDLLTEQDIIDVVNQKYYDKGYNNSKLDDKKMKYHSLSEMTTIRNAGEELYDWIQESLWDNFVENDCIETDGSEDFVDEIDENC